MSALKILSCAFWQNRVVPRGISFVSKEMRDFFIFTLCIKVFQLSSSIRQELDLSLMYSIISPIKKDINVPIETNKLSLSPNDSIKIENVNVKLLYI